MSKIYRPSFTLAELEHILSREKAALNPNVSIIRNLDLYLFKARSGVVRESYVPNPRPTMSEKLGFETSALLTKLADKKTRQTLAYAKYLDSGFSAMLASEIEDSQMYRYENGYMNKEEEREWEKKQGVVF